MKRRHVMIELGNLNGWSANLPAVLDAMRLYEVGS